MLRGALHIICFLNVPGGFNPSYALGFTAKEKEVVRKKSNWTKVETYLRENAGVMGFGEGMIMFLTGTPRSWAALEKRLEGSKWKATVRNLATRASALDCVGVGSLVDSLYALKMVVYEKGEKTIDEFKNVLKNNFADAESFRQYLIHRIPKYGQDDNDLKKILFLMVPFQETCLIFLFSMALPYLLYAFPYSHL